MQNNTNSQFMTNMTNMMNMMNKNQKMVFNPKNLDIRFKRSIMNQSLYQSSCGLFKEIPLFKTMTFNYVNTFNPGVPDNICEVEVINEHPIDIAEQYVEKGLQITKVNGLNPIILNVVTKDFSGSNIESLENVKDELLFMRTNLSRAMITPTAYPLKETSCSYVSRVA